MNKKNVYFYKSIQNSISDLPMSRSPQSPSSPTSSVNNLYLSKVLFTLSNSGIDIPQRKQFLDNMTKQICSKVPIENSKYSPVSLKYDRPLNNQEIQTWITALNQYTQYLQTLLTPDDLTDESEYSQTEDKMNADETLRRLINNARNSPKSPVSEKATIIFTSTKKETPNSPTNNSPTPSPKSLLAQKIETQLSRSPNSTLKIQNRSSNTSPQKTPSPKSKRSPIRNSTAEIGVQTANYSPSHSPSEIPSFIPFSQESNIHQAANRPHRSSPLSSNRKGSRTVSPDSLRRSPHSSPKQYSSPKTHIRKEETIISPDFIVDEIIEYSD